MAIGDRIKELRKKFGYSQADLARLIGNISQQAIYRYEGTGGEPTMENLVKIAQVFGVSTDYLLGLEKPKVVNWLTTVRLDAGYKTIRSLANVSGIDHSTLSRLELPNGPVAMPDTLRKLAPHLNVPYIKLMLLSGNITEADMEEYLPQVNGKPDLVDICGEIAVINDLLDQAKIKTEALIDRHRKEVPLP